MKKFSNFYTGFITFAAMPKHRIVITGGGGSGKSSLIEYFIAHGFYAMPEVAREQIRISLENKSRALPWDDIQAFSENVQAQMLKDFNAFPEANYAFYDRCLLDVLSYLVLDKRPSYASLNQAIENYRYFEHVFILPPWQEIFTKDDERMEDFEETIKAYDVIKKTYEAHGYQVVELPKTSVEARVEFILNHLKSHGIEI
jgi:predicted ATPase